MISVGIDVATCTGLAMVGDGEDRGKTIYLEKQRGFLRLQLVASAVEQTLTIWQPSVVVVEDYAYVKNVGAFITLVEVGTVVRMILHQMGLPWVNVVPSALKKWTTGKGNAKKEDMAHAVQLRWGYSSPSHDIVDAYALAQMGQLSPGELASIPGVFFEQPDRFSLTNGSP